MSEIIQNTNTIIKNFIISEKEHYLVKQASQDNQYSRFDDSLDKEMRDAISFIKTDFGELQKELGWSSKKLYELLYKQKVPRLYRYTEKVTFFLFALSIVFMYFDFTYSLTSLGVSGYIMFWLCCGAMFVTNLWAKYEWKGTHKRVCVLENERKMID